VVTGCYDKTLRLWRVADGGLIAELNGHKDKVIRVAINPIDGRIASGSEDGEIRLWDGNTGRYLRTLGDQRTRVGKLVFSPDGQWLLSTCAWGHPCHDRVWDVATGRELAKHKIDENIVLGAAISPDGRLAATGGGNNSLIHVWEMAFPYGSGEQSPGVSTASASTGLRDG
jgi:WD40 repeat protein